MADPSKRTRIIHNFFALIKMINSLIIYLRIIREFF